MIRVTPESVVIENLTVSIPEVREFLARQVEAHGEGAVLEECVRRCLHLGALALERATVAGPVDFMRKEVESMLDRLKGELGKQIGSGKGQVLEPVQQKVEEVRELLKRDFDPRNPESFLMNMRNLLDPQRKDSIQGHLDQSIRDLADRDKPLGASLRNMMEEALKPLLERLQGLEKDATLAEHSPLKGLKFEEEVEENLGQWAQHAHAEVERVGGDNDTGDFLVRMRDPLHPQRQTTIAIEAKDDTRGLGRKRLADAVQPVFDVRQPDAVIWLCKTSEGFAKEIGEWSEGLLHDGRRWIACTMEHLHVAIRWAWIQWKLDEARKEQVTLNVAGIRQEVQGLRDRLKQFQNINEAASNIRSKADSILDAAALLKKDIKTHLDRLEEELRKADPAPESEAQAA